MAINEVLPEVLLPPGLGYQPVRVASHSKMSSVLQFALNHLTTSTSPLVLHSIPSPSSASASTSADALPNPAPPTATATTLPAPAYKPNKTAESGVTKLVSIAEIIKRTRAEAVATAAGGKADAKGKGRAVEGVHQYTMVGALEELGEYAEVEGEFDEAARREEVAVEWLKGGGGGTKRPRKKHTPFMLVVLSHAPVLELAGWPNFFHQPPSSLPAPPLSQPSKKRALATAAAALAAAGPADASADAMDVSAPAEVAAEMGAKKKRKRRGKKKKAGTEGAGADGEGVAAGEEDADGAAGVSMEL